LRAVAISGVLLNHFYPRLFDLLIPTGSFGVRLFLVLSGFLITRILLESRELRDSGQASTVQVLGHFYGRRALRLFPALWLALAVGWLFLPEVRREWAWHVTYLSNVYFILHGGLPRVTGHLWSLAVTEQFYLIWPIMILGLARWKLAPIVTVLAVAAPLVRVFIASKGEGFPAVYATPLACADSLGFGAILALSLASSPDSKRLCVLVRNWCLPAGLVATIALQRLMLADVLPNGTIQVFAASVLSVGLVAGCVVGFRGPVGRMLESKSLGQLGRLSYGVFIYHFFLMGAWERYAPGWLPHHPGWDPRVPLPVTLESVAYLLILSALTIGIAAASWRWVEAPILGLKRFIPYAKPRWVPVRLEAPL
jgi:peptidoglycan/LPS O-acetylase OafA/YrhL